MANRKGTQTHMKQIFQTNENVLVYRQRIYGVVLFKQGNYGTDWKIWYIFLPYDMFALF